jgi:hypothetical protein
MLRIAIASLIVGAVAVVAPLSAASASAAPAPAASPSVSASAFPASDIISNAVMFTPNTMSAASIQSFLDTKGSGCHATSTLFCLKSFRVTTANVPANSFCSTYTGRSNETAASIISRMTTACGVNPQVILATLQKENSLVKKGGSRTVFDSAMNFNCGPSTCTNPTYKGFFNQITTGTQHWKRDPSSSFPVGSTTAIALGVSSSCGTQAVTIKNKATSRVYQYTPYVPNSAARAGHGDACSVYGNLNFWTLFNDWFGVSVLPDSTESFVKGLYNDVLGRQPGVPDIYSKSKARLGGTSATSMGASVLASSEARSAYVRSQYIAILGRTADSPGVAHWVGEMASGAVKEDNFGATLMASDEFYRDHGSTVTSFINAVYEQVLGRDTSSDPEGLAHWKAVTAKSGRGPVTLAIWRSAENNRKRVNEAFQHYLGHAASSAQITTWANTVAKSGYYTAVSRIIGSAEYASHAVARFPSND